jgi:RNA polymerase-binding protein DksA
MALQDTTHLTRLRARLDERAAVLRAEVEALRAEESEAPTGDVEDAGEQGEERTRRAVRTVEQDRDTRELLDIGAALARLDDGSYGECVDCGVDIPLARLDVQPAAARCIECQERFEASHPPLSPAPLPGTERPR